MENRKLPNATASLILGIISFIACCFSMGIGGIICSGIALFLANKDMKTYALNPEMYDNFSQVKTARTIAIVGLVLGVIALIFSIYSIISMGGVDAYMEMIQEQIQMQQEMQSYI